MKSMRPLGDFLKFHKEGDVGVVRLMGELDTSLREALIVFFDNKLAEGVKNFIIDMSDAEYMSSAVWGAIIMALKHTRERGGDILICSPKGQIEKVYKIMAFDRVFRTFNDVKEALEELKG